MSRFRMTWRRLAFNIAAVVLMSGCGSDEGPTRYTVSGVVTYDGAPVPAGFIIFEPDAARGNKGPGGGAEIRDGRFTTPRNKGTLGGPYIVKIDGFDGVDVESDLGGVDPNGTVLFARYQITIQLPKEDTAQDFLVPVPSD